MAVICSQNVSGELKKAVAEHAADQEGPRTTLYEASVAADGPDIEAALASGQTIAIAHAPVGPVFGGKLPALTHLTEPAALVAVCQRPVGHGRMTSITLIPESAPVGQQFQADEHGRAETGADEQAPVTAATLADIAAAVAEHARASAETKVDSNLIPPDGARFHIVNYPAPWSRLVTQSVWPERRGATQRMASNGSQQFYIYYANGKGAPEPYYVVLAIQSGSVAPAANGVPCCYTLSEKAYVLASNELTLSGNGPAGSSLIGYSPDSTRDSPVYTSMEIPMTVMARAEGGYQSTPFTARRTISVENGDWGVLSTGSAPTNARVKYYNITNWDASDLTPGFFDYWWRRWREHGNVYDRDNNVADQDLPSRFGTKFDTMAAWRVPQNPGNRGPLQFAVEPRQEVQLIGFANGWALRQPYRRLREASLQPLVDNPIPRAWDLVALTQPTG